MTAVEFAVLQFGEHPGVVGAWVLTHDDDQVRAFEVLEGHGCLADADAFAHGPAGGLMAHIRTIRQVVGSEAAGEELVGEGRLVGGTPTGVEHRLVGGFQGVQFGRQHVDGLGPGDGAVVVLAGRLIDGFGETALLAQPIFGASTQLSD